MRFMQSDRALLERYLPGLDAALAARPLAELESPNSLAIGLFREAGGPALLVPAANAGLGADPLDAVRVQRAIGSRCPSLAVATTMHHFSVASLIEAARTGTGLEGLLLEAIATDPLLVASGFAEGRTHQSILRPTIRAEHREGRIVLNGSKKPCSLSRSMDLLTASVMISDDDGRRRLGVAIVPTASEGISVRPFWHTSVLAGAESDEVVLSDVSLDPRMVVMTDAADDQLDRVHLIGFLWFELLMTASYLGVASGLVERVLEQGKGTAVERAAMATELRAAMLALESVARAMADEDRTEAILADALMARYAAQDTIARITPTALAALGGMSFISSDEGTYLASAASALAFHPPARGQMADPLCDFLNGHTLRIGTEHQATPQQTETHTPTPHTTSPAADGSAIPRRKQGETAPNPDAASPPTPAPAPSPHPAPTTP
ncbi:acyl-CoA dehydrogenase family protein [Streptomyces sp. NPDC005728]|uniref:acyl-CoA dehydrogenase family protein n=1 Tax=Streptomyces sp. NPDC005728 TaxID=3157054 RepID=UPI0033FC4A49